MTEEELNDLNEKQLWHRDIQFHKELHGMPPLHQKMFVVGRIFFDICMGLYYMHIWKVAHLDIKFDNFVISSKENGTAMLIDFNNAKLIENPDEKIYVFQGAEAFNAPEYKEIGRATPF